MAINVTMYNHFCHEIIFRTKGVYLFILVKSLIKSDKPAITTKNTKYIKNRITKSDDGGFLDINNSKIGLISVIFENIF